MKIYVDLVLLLNFAFDLILLLTVSILLRRNAPINRIIMGSFIGSLSVLLLFININSFTLFIFKFIISVFMVIITFKFKNIKYTFRNMFYLYISSIVLGGFLYYLNNVFSLKNEGIVFYNNGLSINYIVLIIFSPVILYVYIRQGIKLKNNYNNYYNISYIYDNKKYNFTGFLDSGNHLIYKKRPVILINKKDFKINFNENNIYLVPYKTIDKNSFIRCIKLNEIYIKNIGVRKNVYVGIIDEVINIDGIDCILHYKLLEE